MDCELCKFEMVVLDLQDPDKPLRCSDACPENRKSIAERGVSVTQEDVDEKDGLHTAKRKKK